MTKPMGPEYESSQETEVRVGHSGDLNLERPSNPGAKIHDSPIQDADDIPPTMHYTDEERAEARRIQDEHLKKEETPIAEEEKEAWHQKTKNRMFAGGAAALAIIAFSFVATAGEDDVDTSKSALTNTPEDIARHNERVGNTSAEEAETESPENTDNFEPINQDFRPEDEQNAEYQPVYGHGETPQEVINNIYKNLEKANEERETSYITFYAYDEDSNYAITLINNIESLKNHHPVDINVEVLEDYGIINGEWRLKVRREIDVKTANHDGEPEERLLTLKEKSFGRYHAETDSFEEIVAWTIFSDKKAPIN